MTLSGQAVNAEQVKQDSKNHVLVSWTVQKNANAKPLVITGPQGSYMWDSDGRRYLDFSSQLVNSNIGHQHPRVVAAIQEQAAHLCFISPAFANEARSQLARRLAELTPGDLTRTLFTNG